MKKCIHEIYLRKNLLHLKDKYNLTVAAISDYLEVDEKVVRNFLEGKTTFLRSKNYKRFCKIDKFEDELRKAYEYNPEKLNEE
tara:strand:- start:711 stop:959 length:249 start_codon:yes stop_codon:yes gene_type:complete